MYGDPTTPADASTTFTASATGATSYEWYVNNVLQAGETSDTFIFNTPSVAGNYAVYAAVVNACTASNTA